MPFQRHSENPKPRFQKTEELDNDYIQELLELVQYSGSPHHKSKPSDYGFTVPAAPRPDKTLCDKNRTISRSKANQLLRSGIELGLFSRKLIGNQSIKTPKIVWSVDAETLEVFEAQANQSGSEVDYQYHGYPIYNEVKRRHIIKEWKKRCNKR